MRVYMELTSLKHIYSALAFATHGYTEPFLERRTSNWRIFEMRDYKGPYFIRLSFKAPGYKTHGYKERRWTGRDCKELIRSE